MLITLQLSAGLALLTKVPKSDVGPETGAPHVVQVTVLVVLEYVPSGQISHTVFPEVEYLPAMHETRTPLGHEYPSVHGSQIPRPVAPANVPARHDMHVETPAGEYVFAAHMTGVAPGLVQLYPEGHGRHDVAPREVTYLPSGQVSHAAAPEAE